MHIEVEDVNEYAPTWTHDSYVAEVFAGKLYNQIVRLETIDQDGSDVYSRVCRYNILTPDVPFRVDEQGIVSFLHVLCSPPLSQKIFRSI